MKISEENYFIADVIDEIKKRYDESQNQMKLDPKDKFIEGRALAFQEIKEIIENRIEIYGIDDFLAEE